jgi:carboxypeptidase A2
MRVLALLLTVLAVSSAERRRYDGYQLISVFPRDVHETTYVYEQQADVEIDFWYEGADRFDVLVPPHKLDSFLFDMDSHHVKYEVVKSDIQADLDEELASMTASRAARGGKIIDYDDYNTLEDIYVELDDLVTRCPTGSQCETFVVGKSSEDRDIKGIHIFKSDAGRRAIWLDATTHAREWLSTATLLKILRHLVYDSSDSTVAGYLATYDFWILPVVNPDGYSYTHTNERLWRKSRNVNSGSNCIGTDLNRNFDQMWGNAGASTAACSDTYRGSSAGSEPETKAMQDALSARGASLLFSVHFHTYGYLWLIPWGSVTSGSNCNVATDDAEMMAVANPAADAVQNTFGTNTWARGNSCATIYPASGITMDYSKGVAGVKYTYTPELRGNSFAVAATNIQPSFEEVWNGVVATVSGIEKLEAL